MLTADLFIPLNQAGYARPAENRLLNVFVKRKKHTQAPKVMGRSVWKDLPREEKERA